MIDISSYINHIVNCDCSNDNRIQVVCQENDSRYVLHNDSSFNIEKISVEDCLSYFTQEEKKCDYLLRATKNNDKRLYLVELKGKNIKIAIEQIDNTLNRLQISNRSGFKEVHGRIVPTKTPQILENELKKLDEKFRAMNGRLISKTQNSDTI